MSKEMTAEEYFMDKSRFDGYFRGSTRLYGDLRAKEAVKEFAEELMNGLKLLSVMGSVEPFVKHLAKQKGVEI